VPSRERIGEESSSRLRGFAREYGGSAAHSPAPESRQLRRLYVLVTDISDKAIMPLCLHAYVASFNQAAYSKQVGFLILGSNLI